MHLTEMGDAKCARWKMRVERPCFRWNFHINLEVSKRSKSIESKNIYIFTSQLLDNKIG